MRTIIFQALEFTVLIPGMLLAYLPVNSSLKQKPKKMIAWMLPLLVIISFLSGFVCNRFHLSTRMILLPLLFDVDGIWYAITVAEVFATIISVIFLFAKRKKYQYM